MLEIVTGIWLLCTPAGCAPIEQPPVETTVPDVPGPYTTEPWGWGEWDA